MHNIKQLIISLTMLSVCLATSLFATESSEPVDKLNSDFWPNMQYQSEVPTFQNILGYSAGEKITSFSDMQKYFDALVHSSPKNIKRFVYGKTWEGRDLIYLVIGSEKNIAELNNFKLQMQALVDPRKTNQKQANQLINELPASVWLGYSVHGNEISSTDAAMMTAYHLLAAKSDPMVNNILENTLIFIDPLQNPDGRSRFVNRYYETVGLVDNGDRYSAEHTEPWPSGRVNHYLFDMNRDWLALTQPESKGRVKALNQYLPLVVIDLHEMGGDSSYYFAPPAEPINPHMTKVQLENMAIIGRNNAKHFDQFGFDYFTQEIFDEFYPGYGDSWPAFYGASASTYEVSSSRGENFLKRNGKMLSYKNTVLRHFVASISTIEATSINRKKLLSDFYQYQVSAIKQGEKNKQRVFIMPNVKDKDGNYRLAQLMVEHGVEVLQAEQSFKACGKNYSSGSYILDTAQPRGRFLSTTFEPQVNMDKKFIKEQERRRANKLHDQIYDVTAWSLPLMFNVESHSCGKSVNVKHHRVMPNKQLVGSINHLNPKVGYLVPWGDMATGRFLTAALRQGLVIKSADMAFTLEVDSKGQKKHYPAGTLIIEKRANHKNLDSMVATIVKQTGATVDGIDSSWVSKGPNFGSSNVVTMHAPNIAMAWGDSTNALSAGNTRFVIEQQMNYPVTAINADYLARMDLSHYQVLVLPSGNYKKALGKSGAKNIKAWVKKGGVLLTLGSATTFAADKDSHLLSVKREELFDKDKKSKDESSDKKNTVAGKLINNKKEMIRQIENDKQSPDSVAGVLANVSVDQEHWLTAGINPNLIAMVSGQQIYTPIKLAEGKNVAWFKSQDQLLASGYLWEENRKQLAFKPYLIVQPTGRGMVISFTQDPTSRAYLDGLNVLLMNTLFRSAAHTYGQH